MSVSLINRIKLHTSWLKNSCKIWLYFIIRYRITVIHSSVDSDTRVCSWTATSKFECLYFRVPTPPEKSWIFFFRIPAPGKSWKMTLVLESPGNWSLRFWKVLENYPWKLRIKAFLWWILTSQVAPNFKFFGAVPRTPLGELTALLQIP